MHFICAVCIFVPTALCHYINYKELKRIITCKFIYGQLCIKHFELVIHLIEHCPHKICGLWDRCHLGPVTGILKVRMLLDRPRY